jgi:hypothetical protein
MAKDRAFDTQETSWNVQPPKGSAEGDINYGKAASSPEPRDPMGVVPEEPSTKKLAPSSEG